MPSYATVAQLRELLTQADQGAAADLLMQEQLDEATDIIDGRLGFSWSACGEAAAKDVYMPRAGSFGGSRWLNIPAHQAGSVAKVAYIYSKGASYETTEEWLDWTELEDGRLYCDGGWSSDAWYRITAPWGYGDVPAALRRVCLEIAINLWGARDSKQISDVVGVEGAVGYNRALTNRQRTIIDDCRVRAGEFGIA